MGDFRINYGIAYGNQNNFFATTAGVFAESDTTPDVTTGSLFFSNNTSNTTITHFDLTGFGAGSQAGQFEGKCIRVVFLDGSTRLANAARLVLSSSDGLQGANNAIELVYHNSSWLEFSRSYNQSNFLSVNSVNLQTSSAIFPNADTGNIVVRGRGQTVTLNLLHDSTGNWALRRVLADPGTLLTLICGGDSQSQVIVNSAAADTFVCQSSASSTQFRLATSASISFVKGSQKWFEVGNVWTATNGNIAT